MTGVGGGSLMTPLLILLFGFSRTAVGTDLLYAAATKTGGSLIHGLSHTIDWRIVGRLATGSVPLTALTLVALSRLDIHGVAARQVLTGVLSGALFLTATALIFRRQILEQYASRTRGMEPRHGGSHHCGRRCAGRAGVDLVGRGGCHRRDRSDPALSATAHGAYRRFRHRPCGPAHARRRHWPLDVGLGRLESLRLAARRFVAGHFPRQLHGDPGAGSGSVPGARGDAP